MDELTVAAPPSLPDPLVIDRIDIGDAAMTVGLCDDPDRLVEAWWAIGEILGDLKLLQSDVVERLAKVVGQGTITSPWGTIKVGPVPVSSTTDWERILATVEKRSLYTESGELRDPHEIVAEFRKHMMAIAPLTPSQKPKAAIDTIMPRGDVVETKWGGTHSVRAL